MVVLAESKIDDLEFLCMWVDEDVDWFDVSMHKSLRVDIIESLSGLMSTSKSFLV